eukprot:jgi/Bigna1/66247/fgenesh1_pg.1_\
MRLGALPSHPSTSSYTSVNWNFQRRVKVGRDSGCGVASSTWLLWVIFVVTALTTTTTTKSSFSSTSNDERNEDNRPILKQLNGLGSSPSLPPPPSSQSEPPPPAFLKMEDHLRDPFRQDGQKGGDNSENNNSGSLKLETVVAARSNKTMYKVPLGFKRQEIPKPDPMKELVGYISKDGRKRVTTYEKMLNATDVPETELSSGSADVGTDVTIAVMGGGDDFFADGSQRVDLPAALPTEKRRELLSKAITGNKKALMIQDEVRFGTRVELLGKRLDAFVPHLDAPDEFDEPKTSIGEVFHGQLSKDPETGKKKIEMKTMDDILNKKRGFLPNLTPQQYSLYTGLIGGAVYWLRSVWINYQRSKINRRFQDAMSLAAGCNMTLAEFMNNTDATIPESDKPMRFFVAAWHQKGGFVTKGENLEYQLQMMVELFRERVKAKDDFTSILKEYSADDVPDQYKPVYSSAVSRNTIEVLVWKRLGARFKDEELAAIDAATLNANRKQFEQVNVDLRKRSVLMRKEGASFTDFMQMMRSKKFVSREARDIGVLAQAWVKTGGSFSRLEGVNAELTNLQESMQTSVASGVTFTEFMQSFTPEDVVTDKDGRARTWQIQSDGARKH